jgi:hypothetical protein
MVAAVLVGTSLLTLFAVQQMSSPKGETLPSPSADGASTKDPEANANTEPDFGLDRAEASIKDEAETGTASTLPESHVGALAVRPFLIAKNVKPETRPSILELPEGDHAFAVGYAVEPGAPQISEVTWKDGGAMLIQEGGVSTHRFEEAKDISVNQARVSIAVDGMMAPRAKRSVWAVHPVRPKERTDPYRALVDFEEMDPSDGGTSGRIRCGYADAPTHERLESLAAIGDTRLHCRSTGDRVRPTTSLWTDTSSNGRWSPTITTFDMTPGLFPPLIPVKPSEAVLREVTPCTRHGGCQEPPAFLTGVLAQRSAEKTSIVVDDQVADLPDSFPERRKVDGFASTGFAHLLSFGGPELMVSIRDHGSLSPWTYKPLDLKVDDPTVWPRSAPCASPRRTIVDSGKTTTLLVVAVAERCPKKEASIALYLVRDLPKFNAFELERVIEFPNSRFGSGAVVQWSMDFFWGAGRGWQSFVAYSLTSNLETSLWGATIQIEE